MLTSSTTLKTHRHLTSVLLTTHSLSSPPILHSGKEGYEGSYFSKRKEVKQKIFYVIFLLDRYVGCTGQMNEDDYEGHELMFILLREGSLQRCVGCGQVFKLVRLRNEYSPEMDYYLSNFHPYDMQEMAESDTTILMSPWKYASHYEYTQFETPSNMVYSLVNPDEHDRLLVDPAYRMERTKALEEKYKVYTSSLREVEKQFEERFGKAG